MTIQETLKRETQGRFFWLFMTLLAVVMVIPLVQAERWGRFLVEAALTGVLIASLWTVRDERKERRWTFGLALPALLVGWVAVAFPHPMVQSLGQTFLILFMVYVTVVLVRYVAVARQVTRDTLFAAFGAYMLIGLVFAVLYVIADSLQPGSLGLGEHPLGQASPMSAATYLSFVTITTLGYGDITPAFGLAASLAPVEALLGQIFMAALVARLVGLYTTQQHAGNE
jgi:voltage-gated potassium channel